MVLVAKLNELPTNDMAVLAWTRTVVRNKSVDWVRRRQLQRRAVVTIAESNERLDGKASMTPMHLAETQEQRHLVHRVLENLPDEYRQVIELRYLDDLSNDEIADVIGLTSSATNSLLYRARKSFRCEHQRLVAPVEPGRSNALGRGGQS
ncbi:RNA polymerase sigma factor 70, region 4 type 2 domain protein [Rhodopirellula sp. SWK7]|nr:RNA polymerase sigma factor 70, region 4 type 2 domain protein [Rhodopirellula sp. SWK7]